MLGRFWGHLRSWVTRAANVGRGADVLNDWVNAATREYVPGKTLGPLHDGWLIMDRNRAPMSGIELEQYQKACVDRLTEPARQERGDPVSQSALEQLLGAVSKSGAQSVLFIPPTPSAHNFFPTAERERALTILDFSDVRQNAALFVPEHRLDIDHLNTAGAELFSRMLALRFAELAKGGSSKP